MTFKNDFKLYFNLILLVILIMINFGCTSEITSSDSDIIIDFSDGSEVQLIEAIKEFSVKNKLKIKNESREFNSGLNTVIYEINNEKGVKIFKVSGIVGESRYVISAYKIRNNNSEETFKSLFYFVKEKLPNQKVEIKKHGE